MKLIVQIFLLPFYGVFKAINLKDIKLELKNSNSILKVIVKRLIGIFLILGLVTPVWSKVYNFFGQQVFAYLGYRKDTIQIAGTGSMYPTFPKGLGKTPDEMFNEVVSTPGMFPYPNGFYFRGKRYFGHKLGRGDIVVIEDETIKKLTKSVYGSESGWVKRIIGLPGDILELREGVVYLNKEPIREKYTAIPHSTFGQKFLSECKEITVPENSIFVMGDNRKGSGDSREIGFISVDSINHVLPFSLQIGTLDKNWRDTSQDLEETSKIQLNKNDYLSILNKKRAGFGVSKLKYEQKLENSANLRSQVILKYDDFSFEATRSGYTMKRAMTDSGYSNIVWGEVPTVGYYDAQELIENQFEFSDSKEFLLNPDFDELGISIEEGKINNCPTQIIVIHFAGYVPPNYKKEDIESWEEALNKLKEISQGWRNLGNYPSFYDSRKTEIDRINQIIDMRIERISKILTRMLANEWLTDEELKYISEDSSLASEEDALAMKINNSI